MSFPDFGTCIGFDPWTEAFQNLLSLAAPLRAL
jgi:hypothetical protein